MQTISSLISQIIQQWVDDKRTRNRELWLIANEDKIVEEAKKLVQKDEGKSNG